MSRVDLVAEFRRSNQINKDDRFLSDEQINAWIDEGLRTISTACPRRNVLGVIEYVAGSRYAMLPNDIIPELTDFSSVVSRDSIPVTNGQFVAPTALPVGFRRWAPRTSYDVIRDESRPKVAITSFRVGNETESRWALLLQASANVTELVEFAYSARHRVDDGSIETGEPPINTLKGDLETRLIVYLSSRAAAARSEWMATFNPQAAQILAKRAEDLEQRFLRGLRPIGVQTLPVEVNVVLF